MIYKEIAKGVDGVVVNAVFEGQLIRGVSIGIVIAGKGLDEALGFGGDYEPAFAVAGAYGPAD